MAGDMPSPNSPEGQAIFADFHRRGSGRSMTEPIMSLWQVRRAKDELRDARAVFPLCRTVEILAAALRDIVPLIEQEGWDVSRDAKKQMYVRLLRINAELAQLAQEEVSDEPRA